MKSTWLIVSVIKKIILNSIKVKGLYTKYSIIILKNNKGKS